LENKLWGEAIISITPLENVLKSQAYPEPAVVSFDEMTKEQLKTMSRALQNRHPFGEVGIVTNRDTQSMKAKMKDRGIPMLYLGPALDHSGDTHRMLNLQTERVINSRNIAWLRKSYGCWKGQEETPIGENVSSVEWEERTPDNDGKSIPQTVSDDEEDPPDEPPTLLERQDANEGEPAETDLSVEPSSRLLRDMARRSATYNQEAESLADRIRSVAQGTRTGGEQAANAFTMIDRFSGDFGMFCEFGMAMEDGSPDGIKLEEYKDHFQTPRTFKEAWDHPDPFQRKMWRDAIGKEFTKMNEKKV
jgi:hypothetical protein